MKLYSWNVNGIRSVLKKGTFQSFMADEKPDIVCLQETKAERGQIEIELPGYHEYWKSSGKPLITLTGSCRAKIAVPE